MSFDPDTTNIDKICKSLLGSEITISFGITLQNGKNTSGDINDCNIIGNCLENILLPFINISIPTFLKGPPGQKPDYHNNGWWWELKCFKKSPGFDIGSITGYIEDISKQHGIENKINVRYLIFEYKEKEGGSVEIVNFWTLSVCDLCCGYSGEKPLNCGGQSGVNIRPSGKGLWTSEKSKKDRNVTNFLDRIEKLIQSKYYKISEDEKQQKLVSIQTQRKTLGI